MTCEELLDLEPDFVLVAYCEHGFYLVFLPFRLVLEALQLRRDCSYLLLYRLRRFHGMLKGSFGVSHVFVRLHDYDSLFCGHPLHHVLDNAVRFLVYDLHRDNVCVFQLGFQGPLSKVTLELIYCKREKHLWHKRHARVHKSLGAELCSEV